MTHPQLVTELDLPYLDTIGLERRDAIDAIEAARAQHWLARTDMGYSVTGLQDVTAILRDQRFHSALSMHRAGARAAGLRLCASRRGRVHPHHGGRRPRPPPPPGGAGLHPGLGQPAAPDHAHGRRRLWSTGRRPGRVRAGGRRLRALPHPDHLRAAGCAARGLEAVLGLGHRHLPHLQQQPGRGPAADRARRARS